MEEIELMNHRAIIEIPENSVKLKLVIDVYDDDDGEIKTVSAEYGLSQIREMFRKADNGYIDDDDKFYITEKGREYLKAIERGEL